MEKNKPETGITLEMIEKYYAWLITKSIAERNNVVMEKTSHSISDLFKHMEAAQAECDKRNKEEG